MKQCKVGGTECFISNLKDIYCYIRQITNDDFADIVEIMVDSELSDKDDEIYALETELEEAHEEIDNLEEQLSNTEEELYEARETIS